MFFNGNIRGNMLGRAHVKSRTTSVATIAKTPSLKASARVLLAMLLNSTGGRCSSDFLNSEKYKQTQTNINSAQSNAIAIQFS